MIKLCRWCARVALVSILAIGANAADYPGSVVTKVTPHYGGARGGIEVGDQFTHWSYADATGERFPLDHAFHLRLLEREVHSIRQVTLHGVRGQQAISIAPGYGRWGLTTLPVWDVAAQEGFDALLEALAAGGDVDALRAQAAALAETLSQAGATDQAAWLYVSLASAADTPASRSLAAEWFRESAALLSTSALRDAHALSLFFVGHAYRRLNQFAEARHNFEAAHAAESAISPMRLAVAANDYALAQLAFQASRMDEARERLNRALTLQQQLAPGAIVQAGTLSLLGRVAAQQGDLVNAQQHFSQAYEIAQARVPNGVAASGYLNALAIAAYWQGNLAEAERHWTRGLELKRKLEPGTVNFAAVLFNVGLLHRERGNLRAAEAHYLEALAIHEAEEPNSLGTARVLNNLGSIALEQDDTANARYYHERTRALREQVVPDSLELAVSLINLGNVEREEQRFELARDYYLRALAIQTKHAPGSVRHALILTNLGVMAKLADDLDAAAGHFMAALEVYQALQPNGANVAEVQTRLGEVALLQGKVADAGARFAEANSILARIAPLSFRAARAWYGLARVAQARGEIIRARDYYESAIDAIEGQSERLGGYDESRASLRSRHANVYQDYMHLLLSEGDQEKAFEIYEQSRAQELNTLLNQRDLSIYGDLPDTLANRQRSLATLYEQAQSDLYAAEGAEQQAALRDELLDLRRQQNALWREIRDAAPALANLRAPQAGFAQLIARTPTGAATIAFSVAAERTDVFVVTADRELVVTTLPHTAATLEKAITRLRYLLDAGRWDSAASPALLQQSAALYEQLIAPIEEHISAADSLIVIPDGPLNVLPVAALRRTTGQTSDWMARWKPILSVSSLAVFEQLENSAPRERPQLVAFGNPAYPETESVAVTRAGYRLNDLKPLPWSEREVQNISAAFPDTSSVFLGADATEERAKSLPAAVDVLHFATHAALNEQQPLDTAIVLSIADSGDGATENGFLHVWEIYENVRLNARLVTLSGCETALGSAYAGEGLIGLTRAFHFAGASSVMASLWNVNDRSTSDLMTHFYRAMADGQSLATALQAAQIAMIEDRPAQEVGLIDRLRGLFRSDDEAIPSRSHPYHWAGFVLSGRGE